MTGTFWTGVEWERHVDRLLSRRYGLGEYVQIPDRHVGDYGLEGFSFDGCAYQCFAAQEPLTSRQLYEKQRDKITADLSKLRSYEREIASLLGNVKLRRWILVVPRHDSAALIAHAQQKSQEVGSWRLPFIANDFQVTIETETAFAVELRELAAVGLSPLHYDSTAPAAERVESWIASAGNVELIANLSRKLGKLPSLVDEERRTEFEQIMIRKYLIGQHHLARLKDEHPHVWEKVDHQKQGREKLLDIHSHLGESGGTGTILEGELAQLRADLLGVGGLSSPICSDLAWEAIADWLLRCPLDFPDGASHG